jgi:hypothetical protein
MESLIIEEEALGSQTGITGEKGHYLWNPKSLMRRPCGAKPE